MAHNKKFQRQRFLIFWFLYTGFYCIYLLSSLKITPSWKITRIIRNRDIFKEREGLGWGTKFRGKRTCKVNQAGENSSFIFTVCVRSVSRYHFKLAYVILQMAAKEFSKPTSKMKLLIFNPQSNELNFSYNDVQHLLWRKTLYRLTTLLYVVVSCCMLLYHVVCCCIMLYVVVSCCMKFARDQKCLHKKCCATEHFFCFQRYCMLLLSFDHLSKFCCVGACAVGFWFPAIINLAFYLLSTCTWKVLKS